MFTDTQKAALSAPLNRANVKSRKQGGRDVSYIEGWKAIEEANRIFGFDGWSRETEFKCVSERERKMTSGEGWGVTYTAKVRIKIGEIIREGVGSGHGIDKDCGQAHESAIKEAETDAMKRALMTFGNPFGLALYDKEQSNVADINEGKVRFIAECEQTIKDFKGTKPALLTWWNSEEQKKARRFFDLTDQELDGLKGAVQTKVATLPDAVKAA